MVDDKFVFKKLIPAVFDTRESLNPIVGETASPVFQGDGFGFNPVACLKIGDSAGESFFDDGFMPLGFDDPLLGWDVRTLGIGRIFFADPLPTDCCQAFGKPVHDCGGSPYCTAQMSGGRYPERTAWGVSRPAPCRS